MIKINENKIPITLADVNRMAYESIKKLYKK